MLFGAQGKISRIEILRVYTRSTDTPLGTYSRNTASALSIRVVPSEESSLLQLPLVEPIVSDLCRIMGLRIVDKVLRRSKYASYSKCYWACIESISVLRVLAVRTLLIPTDEILKVYLQYPHQYRRTSKRMKHSQYLQQCKPEILRESTKHLHYCLEHTLL